MRTACFVLVCLAALPARADTPAQQRLDSGLRHFAAKEYEQAVADFKAGYAIEPRPDLLYAWAQAERLRGNCPAAIRLYEKYLASGVTAEQAKVAADNLARCHKLVGDEPPPPEPTSQPAPPPPPPPAPRLTPPSPSAPPPWYTDTFGDALVVGGLVAVGAGVFLFATSSGTAGDAPNASTYSEYADKIDSAKTQRTVALVAVGAGVALVGVGVVHYFMPRAPVEVTAWLGGVGVGGTF